MYLISTTEFENCKIRMNRLCGVDVVVARLGGFKNFTHSASPSHKGQHRSSLYYLHAISLRDLFDEYSSLITWDEGELQR